MKLWYTLAFVAYTSASPLVEPKVDFCEKVNHIVSIIKANRATPYCSSFLGIPTVTQTSIITETTVLPGPIVTEIQTTGTDTTTNTITVSTTLTSNIPLLITQIISTTISRTTTVTLRKRDLEYIERGIDDKPPLPAFLKAFPSSAISTACSCLNIPAASVTVTTTTTTSPIGPTSTSTIPTAGIETAVTTLAIEATTLITIPTTVTTTTTSTNVVVQTFIPEACKNPILLGNGYFPETFRSFDVIPISNMYDAQRCCSRCWTTLNCFAWAWGGFGGSSNRNCFSIIGTDQQDAAPSNLQGICPNGISPIEQLDVAAAPNNGGIYAFGPCDKGGIPFAV